MPDQDNELQERVCRACNETYAYPLPHSAATRFHCPACADLPAETRSLFEKYNRRIKALTAQIEKLEQKCHLLDPRESQKSKKA